MKLEVNRYKFVVAYFEVSQPKFGVSDFQGAYKDIKRFNILTRLQETPKAMELWSYKSYGTNGIVKHLPLLRQWYGKIPPHHK